MLDKHKFSGFCAVKSNSQITGEDTVPSRKQNM